MNKADYIHAIDELTKIKIKLKDEYYKNVRNVKDEEILIKEEYMLEHAKYKIGDIVIYKNNNGICYDLIIHNMHIDNNGEIAYDVGNLVNITHPLVPENELRKIP